MTDDQFRTLTNKIDDVKREAGNKGNIIVIWLFLFVFWAFGVTDDRIDAVKDIVIKIQNTIQNTQVQQLTNKGTPR
jgi:cellobiose-specific phosphotransferase system component IIC